MEVKELSKKEVLIQSLDRVQFSGISKYPRSVTTLTTELGPDGLYKTGLTEEEERKYEKLLGLKDGELSRRSEWWGSLSISIRNRKLTLSLEHPINYLKYKVLLESTKVANSVGEKNKWPDAMFVLYDEEENAKRENVSFNVKKKAYVELDKLSLAQKRGILKIFGKRKPETVSEEVIDNTISHIVESEPERFLTVAADKKLDKRIFVEDCIAEGIIHKTNNYFKNGDDPIGTDFEEVIDYLDDPENQNVYIGLKNKLKTKRK